MKINMTKETKYYGSKRVHHYYARENNFYLAVNGCSHGSEASEKEEVIQDMTSFWHAKRFTVYAVFEDGSMLELETH